MENKDRRERPSTLVFASEDRERGKRSRDLRSLPRDFSGSFYKLGLLKTLLFDRAWVGSASDSNVEGVLYKFHIYIYTLERDILEVYECCVHVCVHVCGCVCVRARVNVCVWGRP